MSGVPSILSEDMWLALESDFAEQLAGITPPVTPEPACRERLSIATPLTHIKPRVIPDDRSDFTRESEALI